MGFFPELPAFIWEDILEFLSFRKKILIEKKSLLLKNLCLKYGYNYKEVRFFPTFLDEDRYIAGLDDISKMRAFRAFFTRCSKLTFLYIKEDIINSFIGRFFYLLKNITHLSIQQPVGMVYLNVIEEHLAHSLISLGLVLNNQEETIPSCIHLLVNLIKLESLKINKFDSLYQKSINMELQQFLPSTIKNLFISEYTRESLFAVKENCPEISSLLFIELANFRVVLNEQILSTRFPNLVHLDFYWPSYRSDPIILTKLLNFNHLSSFSIKMFIYDLNVEEAILFHEYTFEGRRFDAFFLDILIELNTKNRLRNLEFNYSADFYLNKEYVILIFSHLKELESFKCTLQHVGDEITLEDQFFSEINNILKINNRASPFTFRFIINNNDLQPINYIFFWQNSQCFKLSRIGIFLPDKLNIIDSVVVNEICCQRFGDRNTFAILYFFIFIFRMIFFENDD